jgi:hypothetical protein
VKLVALELEEELPLLQARLPVLDRHPFAAVPDDDPAGAVVAFGDHALEVAVVERVILDAHGEPLVGLVV